MIISRPFLVRLAYVSLSLALFGMDRATKTLVVRRLPLYESVPVVEGFFHLTHVANTGALFGLLAGLSSPLRGLIFVTVPILAIFLIVAFQLRSPETDLVTQVGLSLILGGASGNLIDRIRYGEVVDFLDVHIASYHWPTFNVADASISLGAALLVLQMVRDRSKGEGHHA